jgi:hypothetical protein
MLPFGARRIGVRLPEIRQCSGHAACERSVRSDFSKEDNVLAYFVAAFAMALAASCFLILSAAVDHFDPLEETSAPKPEPASPQPRAWSFPLAAARGASRNEDLRRTA